MLVLLIPIVTLVVSHLVDSIEVTPTITIHSGQLQGYIAAINNTGGLKVRGYLGIPFAKAKRFEPPEPPEPWDGIKSMMSFGKACPQMFTQVGAQTVEDMSEDCLNLNVYVPDDTSSSSPLPVMVWIYGGGFFAGSNRIYDGSYIAALGKVVVVAINYRVSVFGFLTNGGDIKGNYGMLDQVEALKWVQRNIAAFNGDSNKVTIFGESAGGSSVSLLMLSKLTKGLFHRAIPQSGDASAYWATGNHKSRMKSMDVFSKSVGCPEDLSKLRDCLKPKDAMAIINASLVCPVSTFIPIVDNHFLHDEPMELYENQDFERYDIMTGVTNDEGLVFTNFFGGILGGLNVTNGVSRETFLAFLRGGGLSRVIPDPKSVLINTTIYRYTDYTNVSSPIINRRMYVDLQSDMRFLAPAIRAANALVKKKAKTYFYLFEHRYGDLLMGSKLPSWVESYHGADVAFVFGFPLISSPPVTTETDARFTRDIIRYWTNFAKTGDPNSPVRVDVTWPEYNQEQQQYISLKPNNMSIHSHLRADFMAYWNCLISEALRAASEPCGAHQSHVEKQSTEGKEEL